MLRPSPTASVLLVVSLLLVAGCAPAGDGGATTPRRGVDTLAAAPRAGTDGSSGRADGSSGPADGVDGDVALVARAVATSTGLQRAISTVRRRYPKLRERLAPLARVHAAHRRVLAGALPDGAGVAPGDSGPGLGPTSRPAQALALLQVREQRAGRVLTRLVVRARSGPFARLLASMAAATAQARVALGAAPAEGGGAAPDPGGPGTAAARTDPGARSAEGAVTALQDALAAEHAALWLEGLLGARTSASGAPSTYVAIDAAYDAHRARRDGLEGQLRALGAEPVAASPTYQPPARVTSLSEVRRLGRRIERTTAGWWSALVATSVGPLRRDAAAALADAAVRQLAFGARPRAFPGAPELGNG